MNLPAFTAEASCYRTNRTYQASAILAAAEGVPSIIPADSPPCSRQDPRFCGALTGNPFCCPPHTVCCQQDCTQESPVCQACCPVSNPRCCEQGSTSFGTPTFLGCPSGRERCGTLKTKNMAAPACCPEGQKCCDSTTHSCCVEGKEICTSGLPGGGNVCCPIERSCGKGCCGENEVCLGGVCCPAKGDWVNCGGSCCPRGQCTIEGCCPAGRAICDNHCCADREECRNGACSPPSPPPPETCTETWSYKEICVPPFDWPCWWVRDKCFRTCCTTDGDERLCGVSEC